MTIKVRQAEVSDQHELAKMRELLWPESSLEEHRKELDTVLRSAKQRLVPHRAPKAQPIPAWGNAPGNRLTQ